MKRTLLVALILLALLLPGCYVNYHHRYFARLHRENHPLLIWIAMYGTPMEVDYPQENAMFRKYDNPDDVGWLGWFEDADGNAIAFVGLDRRVLFVSEIRR